jgi:hypothetical protein
MSDRVALATSAADRCIAGSPSRRPGNFLLRGQKKVTKEEALNRIPAPHAQAAPCNSRAVGGQTRPAALSLLSLSPALRLAPAGRLTRGCTPCSRKSEMQRRSGDATVAPPPPGRRRPSDAVLGIAREPGVQPALSGVKVRAAVLVIGTAARAQRFASARNANRGFRAPLSASWRWLAVQGLFFGDFLLAPQKKTEGFGEAKVTPPPGGTPGNGPCH